MKHRIERILGIVVVVCILLGVLLVSVYAEDEDHISQITSNEETEIEQLLTTEEQLLNIGEEDLDIFDSINEDESLEETDEIVLFEEMEPEEELLFSTTDDQKEYIEVTGYPLDAT